jgi:RNA polymerase sigma factor (sigma-70 family)
LPRTYGHHWLTEDKKKLAAENFNLVWYFIGQILKRNKIEPYEVDEAAGHIIMHYCWACETFDSEKYNKFSPYAYSAFYSGLHRYKSLRKRYYERFIDVDFGGTNENGDRNLDPPYEDRIRISVLCDKLSSVVDNSELNSFERQVVHYKYFMGLSNRSISMKLGYDSGKISSCVNSSIKKIRSYIDENGYIFTDFIAEANSYA